MAAPTIKVFTPKERPTAGDLNQIYQTLAAKFGSLDGSDFMYPFIMGGDLDMGGNSLLRVKELFGILNLEEYGTDEEAFNNAINDLESGGLILIPRNTTITLNRGLKMRNNRNRVYIVGCGFSSQIKIADGADEDAIQVDGCHSFKISNLFINGNKSAQSAGHGISIRGSDEFEISNCWIGDSPTTGTKHSGIKVTHSKHFSISRCWVKNPSHTCIHIEDSEDYSVTNCMMTMAGDNTVRGHDGVLVRDSASGSITGCHIRDIAGNGINFRDVSTTKVSGNAIRGFGNKPISGHRHGIVVYGTDLDDPSSGVSVIGNTATGGADSNTTGITVGGGVVGCNVVANYCLGNGKSLRHYPGEIGRANFRGNICMKSSHHGRSVFQNAASVTTLRVGEEGLPIGAIHATWDVWPPSTVKKCVLGARYYGTVISFYNSSALTGSNTFWYSIEV